MLRTCYNYYLFAYFNRNELPPKSSKLALELVSLIRAIIIIIIGLMLRRRGETVVNGPIKWNLHLDARAEKRKLIWNDSIRTTVDNIFYKKLKFLPPQSRPILDVWLVPLLYGILVRSIGFPLSSLSFLFGKYPTLDSVIEIVRKIMVIRLEKCVYPVSIQERYRITITILCSPNIPRVICDKIRKINDFTLHDSWQFLYKWPFSF